jgi:hypothetical protein
MNTRKVLVPFLFAAALTGCVADDEFAVDDGPYGDELTDETLLGDEPVAAQTAALDCPSPGCPPPAPPADPLPPPPPLASPNAAGFQGLSLIRLGIDAAINDVITETNNDPDVDGTLSWRGQGPWTCGYECNHPPNNAYPGRPYAESTTWVHLRYKQWVVIKRDIDVPVDVRAYCANWQYTGVGELLVQVRPRPAIISGGSWIESIVNFFSAGHLSEYISQRVSGSAPTGGSSVMHLGPCTSLGVKTGYPTWPADDGFTWDLPSKGPVVWPPVVVVGDLQSSP